MDIRFHQNWDNGGRVLKSWMSQKEIKKKG
jgi:hypothetical protein